MKPTSIKAYREIKANGTLTNSQFKVYNYLSTFGAQTAEVIDRLNGPSSHKRLSELERMGKVERYGTTRSTTTGKIVYKWRVTAQGILPLMMVKKPTRAALEAEIKLLRAVRDEQVNKLSSIYDKAHRHGFDDCYRLIKLMGIL